MDYSALYHIMFNAATDAVEAVSQGEAEHARELLIAAQQRCEEEYVSDCSEAAASNARARADYAQMARAALRASPVASMELPGAWRASPITMTCGARSLSFSSRVLLDL